MTNKKLVVLPLATALAALATSANADVPQVQAVDQGLGPTESQTALSTGVAANTVFTAGEELLGLLVTKNADGTVVASPTVELQHLMNWPRLFSGIGDAN